MSYIGATGLNEIDDLIASSIEDASNTLVSRIVYDINNTSNYVLSTSNILVKRITDEIKHTSNYADTLDLRIKTLEGTEGSPGDISLGIPAIPSTGLIALAGSIALATGACIMLNGTTALAYIDSVNAKVDSNHTATNTALTNKQATLTSTNTIGVFNTPDDFVVNGTKIELTKNTSNYVDRINTALTTAIGLKQNALTSTNTIGVFNTPNDFVVNGTKIELTKNTSNYVDRINTALTTAIGLKQDALTSTNTIGVFNTPNDFVVNGTKIELTKNTSNYVSRINTELTTAIGLKQGTLTGSTLSDFLNTTNDFVYNTGTTKIDLSKNTSNYVARINTELTTSIASVPNYWTKTGTNIYFNQAGNVGIGTTDPNNNLHIYRPNNNIPSFTTQNYISSTTPTTITSTPTIASTAISGTIYKLMTFTYTTDTVGFPGQTQYIINVPNNVLCDILVIGGGGGGINNYIHFDNTNYPGGGGGAGALIYFKNYVLSTGTYNIYVGKGGLGNGSSGTSSYIKDNNNINIRASGGGGGGKWTSKNGDNGGSGGGAGYGCSSGAAVSTLNIPVKVYGFNGNDGYTSQGGGGGGAGGGGFHALSGGHGGAGKQIDITGTNTFYAGGGGGGGSGQGGSGIGGNGGGAGASGLSGATDTGSGGGGGYTSGGVGANGIVLIRYKTCEGNPELQLVSGSTITNGQIYKMGIYNGAFQIKTSISDINDDDYSLTLKNGNVGIGTTNPLYKLQIKGILYNEGDTITSGNTNTLGNTITSGNTNTVGNTNISGNTMISGNVGIGTTSAIAPNKLHISTQSQITTLKIQSNGTLPTEISSLPIATTSAIVDVDRYMIFTYTTTTAGYTGQTLYTITLTQNYICDILIVGGGGGGGQGSYENGGGGGGGVVYMKEKLFTTGTYKIIVGDGGAAATIGYDSKITLSNDTTINYDNVVGLGKGGGAGGGGSGGSGAGGNKNGGAGSATQGNTFWNGSIYVAGGFGGQNGGAYNGGGGGGSGEIGGTDGGLEGGDGRVVNITGVNTFYAGGGSGGGYGVTPGGDGGGGGTGNWGSSGGAGISGTGGGGGGAYSVSTVSGGKGGSGVIIIRYRNILPTTIGSSIELNRASSTYKIGNYNNDFKIMSNDSGTDNDRLIINSIGNVGIGVTNPSNILQVGSGGRLRIANNTADQTVIGGDDVASAGASRIELKGSLIGGVGANNNGNIWYYARGFHIFYINNIEIVRMVNTGLYFSSVNNFFSNNGRTQLMGRTGIGKTEDAIYILDVLGDARITGNPRINGNLGIGMDASYRLDVVSTSASSGAITARYFNPSTTALTYQSPVTFNDVCARFGSTLWCQSWITSSSDTRIKEDIEDINDDSALQMILAIEPKTYKYVDKIAKGDNKVYGFIAQQIREVLPDAVSLQPNYIPNIMLLADYDNEVITLPTQPTKVIIKLNDKIRCYDKDNKIVDVEVIEIIDGLTLPEGTDLPLGLRYKIKFNDNDIKYTDNKIFVSGTEVDDFHTISKEYIFTLNVCATQELHRKIKSQDDRIKELETKMEQILNNV